MAATYIRNRCYNPQIKQTPYGLITSLKPDVGKLHLFGSLCYAYIQRHKKKLDARSQKGYFVGYDKDSPYYLVFYPESNSISKHCLVQFTDKFKIDVDDDNTGLFEDKLCEDKLTMQVPSEIENEKSRDDEILPDEYEDENEDGKRYPKRRTQPPEYLRDYVSSVNFDYCYMMNVPTSYQDALKDVNFAEWKSGMDIEINLLESNKTFLVTELPDDKKVVGGRWVRCQRKYRGLALYKAHYVEQGRSQVHGVDYLFTNTNRYEF